MYELINEEIQVFANFTKAGPEPICFSWRNRDYNINTINFVHKSTEGDTLLVHYAVSTDTENYKLIFNTKDLTWKLEEIYLTKFTNSPRLNDKYKTVKAKSYFPH